MLQRHSHPQRLSPQPRQESLLIHHTLDADEWRKLNKISSLRSPRCANQRRTAGAHATLGLHQERSHPTNDGTPSYRGSFHWAVLSLLPRGPLAEQAPPTLDSTFRQQAAQLRRPLLGSCRPSTPSPSAPSPADPAFAWGRDVKHRHAPLRA